MKLVQSMLALALAGAMASAASAHADSTFNIGMLSTTPYVNTSTVVAGTVFTLPPTGATPYNFTDTYNFSVAGTPTTAGTAVTVDLDLGSFGFHISNLKLDLFSGATWLAGDLVTGSSDVSVSVSSVLAAGNYSFKLRGLADGAGTNQGIYTFSAAAVPEAESYGMMLAGIGLVGFMVSRRRGSL
ncbi:MAG: FxDxF family PEP-CTERM protein [Thiobacillus sp.]|nr:FxDxF family PEP-CTERM protein [Thiobacillus sp.]